MNNFHFS